jgi:ribosomal protein S18 acetylase RimI-like enzyme
MEGWTIRHILPDDYRPIITVLDDWWGGRQMRDMLPKLFFVHFRPTSFAAEKDGQIVGFVIGFASQTDPSEAYIHFVGVHPGLRGSGLGRELYETFFKTALALGCRKVSCVTSPVNKGSIAFHQQMGFTAVESGKRVEGVPVFEGYDGDGEDRVMFIRELLTIGTCGLGWGDSTLKG